MDKVIFSYSTKQAVQDGVLHEVEQAVSSEAGIKFPVFITSRAWERYVEVPKGMEGHQDLSGRLWDLLYMFAFMAKTVKSNTMKFYFVCQIPLASTLLDNEDHDEDEPIIREVELKAVIGPRDIDDPRPGIFIMMPDED